MAAPGWTRATEAQKQIALASLAEGSTFAEAARRCGVASTSTVWRWVQDSAQYRKELQQAKRAALAMASEIVVRTGREMLGRLEDDEQRAELGFTELNRAHGTAVDKIITVAMQEQQEAADTDSELDPDEMLDALAERLTPEHLAALQERMAARNH
tara:strand:+ start:50 stop:517 length:468 start_codon:yes stop_codon:yes gene_type:complete